MTDLFKQIVDLEKRVTGWCQVDKRVALASAVLFTRPAVVVEIGVWGGLSLIPMALACQTLGYGKVVAIDPWDAKASVEGFDPDDPRDRENINWWSQQNHELVHILFMEHLRNFGLLDIVEVRRARSDDVIPPDEIGVFHLDGSHTEQAIRDVDRFAPKVVQGGLIFTDDDSWSSGSPKIALEHLQALGFQPISHLGTGSVWRRK